MIDATCGCGRSIPAKVIETAIFKGVSIRCSKKTGGCGGKVDPTDFADEPTLSEARQALQVKLDKGAECPCCGHYAKRYRRALSALMARYLIALYHLTKDGSWVHNRDVLAQIENRGSNASDYNYLRHWGLTQPADSSREEDKKAGRKPGANGQWRITRKGMEFVEGAIRVPQRLVHVGKKIEGFSGVDITIRDALATKFDYAELMAAR
jgi:hypothetical protein